MTTAPESPQPSSSKPAAVGPSSLDIPPSPSGGSSQNRICCIGAGYVGACTMTVIAGHCPHLQIFCVDINQQRIDAWNSSHLPIYEPGLKPLVEKYRGVNLFFSTDVDGIIRACDIIFIAVDTQTKKYGIGSNKTYDMTATEAVARKIALVSESHKIVVEKSTVPVRTGERIQTILNENKRSLSASFDVISNPEFLSEGQAVQNLEEPTRVLIGSLNDAGKAAVERLAVVYRHWVPPERIICTNIWSSELAKLAANAFLAQRVSSVNAFSAVCEITGADIEEVAKVVGMDPRIGSHFLQTSVGFGGSCFKKDLLGLIYLCEYYQLYEVAEYWMQVIKMNEYQKSRFSRQIVESMLGALRGKKIAMFGFAFKKNTADIRESPAIDVSRVLLEEGALVCVYDPKVRLADIHALGGIHQQIVAESTPAAAAADSHAIVIVTEWDEFRTLDYKRMYDSMARPAFLFDGRNILDHNQMAAIGFKTHGIGRPFLFGAHFSL